MKIQILLKNDSNKNCMFIYYAICFHSLDKFIRLFSKEFRKQQESTLYLYFYFVNISSKLRILANLLMKVLVSCRSVQ